MKLTVDIKQFTYETKSSPTLKNMSFQVRDGEFISILGPSGCGKSTLLNVLAGTLTGYEGRILVDDKPIEGVTEHFAYMPQNDMLLPWRTILDNVCLYGEIHHTKKQMLENARQKMVQFGLEGYEDKYPDELSGGMRQRAAFLRTTMCSADIYLLDEPFGALDVITRGDMQDWLRQLCSSMNKTILLVTHDTDEAIYLSDRILILGKPGEGIRSEITVEERNRSRDWLYEQGHLRGQIHKIISSRPS